MIESPATLPDPALSRRDALVLATAFGAASLAPTPPAWASDVEAPVEIFNTTLPTEGGRVAPMRVLAPAPSERRCGVIVFSHGANSTNLAYDRCLIPWARAGYVVIAPNHMDAGGTPPASVLSHDDLWISRVRDLEAPIAQSAAIDALVKRDGRSIDWTKLAATGHSFGGITAQALAGARTTPMVLARPDRRVRAVLALSPPGPMTNFIPEDAWTPIEVPCFVQTGTADVLKGFIDDWRLHLKSAEGASARERWTAVGAGVDHMFGGLICRLRDGAGAQLPALDATTAIGILFLDAFVKRESRASGQLEHALAVQAFAPAMMLKRLS